MMVSPCNFFLKFFFFFKFLIFNYLLFFRSSQTINRLLEMPNGVGIRAAKRKKQEKLVGKIVIRIDAVLIVLANKVL